MNKKKTHGKAEELTTCADSSTEMYQNVCKPKQEAEESKCIQPHSSGVQRDEDEVLYATVIFTAKPPRATDLPQN
ncbi:hypothetical protein GDO81_014724 [Engystomops pustulosus]|uniref:Uncharacterized protein n=1 Tax=Engystomops pustulosus TaxID=76066 RepID=A0AAV7BC21_ENGPU|nr:hypothetical protein GDO81_014724 [Engystomops pustulosus]